MGWQGMAGFWQLAFLIVTVLFHNILCREWPNMTFLNLRAAGWELPIVTGVPSLDFVDNFMFPSKFDTKQIIVGNANGYDDNKGEGCISIFYLRNRIKPVKNIAGNCARRSDSSFAYRDGIGASAQLKYPDHGVMSKDGKFIYFVDSRSCARRIYMWNNAVTTVIGKGTCGNGTLGIGQGLSPGVVGMVFLDSRWAWVFFINIINHQSSFKNGIYIFSWNGRNMRRLSDREQMSSFHTHSMEAGMLTRSAHDEFLVYQKVQYGVTTYNFINMTVKHQESRDHYTFTGYEVTKLFSLRNDGADPGATHKITSSTLYMEAGNGHVSQHPHYKELLMITDHDQGAFFIANTDTGTVKKYCKSERGDIVTHQDPSECRFNRLRSTMWMGGATLAALAADISAWKIHEVSFVNQNVELFHQKCNQCLDAPGRPNCYDSGSGDVHCICFFGYEGPNCERLIDSGNKCNDRGWIWVKWLNNRFNCICDPGWRGDTCNIRDTVLMSYYGARSLRYGHYRAEKSAKIGQGFLMQKLDDPSVLIVGFRGSIYTHGEGAIGYFTLGHLDKFVALAGNLRRSQYSPNFNDGTHAAAHIVVPTFGYQQLGGRFLHFVESFSCARRINLENLQVTTWIGEGRCGNGTLTLNQYGTQAVVSGMTMIEKLGDSKGYFVFSVKFGIYVYPWEMAQDGGHAGVRMVVSPQQLTFYTSIWFPAHIPLAGPLIKKRSTSEQHVFHSTVYGITFYDFSNMSFNNSSHKPLVQRIASLMKISKYLSPESQIDREATHNYDTHQRPMTAHALSIDVNPEFSELLLLTDHALGSLILFNITSGNMLHICRNHGKLEFWMTNDASTCKWAQLRSAMWLTSTQALVNDYSTYQKIYRLSFRINVHPCQHLPCIHGICSNIDNGYTCLCEYDWKGINCTEPQIRPEPIFPALAAVADTGSDTGSLISIGTSAGESFSTLIFILALTSYYLQLRICI